MVGADPGAVNRRYAGVRSAESFNPNGSTHSKVRPRPNALTVR